MAQIESWAQMMAMFTGISGALLGAAVVAALTGLIAYGASLFKVRIGTAKIALAVLASATASSLVTLALAPMLWRMAKDTNSAVTALVTIVLFAVPALVVSYLLEIAGDLRRNQGPAIGMLGYGAFWALVALAALVLAALLPDDVMRFAGGAKNQLWTLLALGGALAFAGYSIGSKLPQRETTSEPPQGNNGENPLPPVKPLVSQKPVLAWIMNNEQRIDVREGELTIGRTKECAIQLTGDDEVGRKHALVRAAGGKITLLDSNSRNGTYLNGDRIAAERVLQDGDKIKVGQSTLTFKKA